MANACIVCGMECKHFLCADCKESQEQREEKYFNWAPCYKHEILHWYDKECPLCKAEEGTVTIGDIRKLAKRYALQELEKEEHPNDIEFEVIDAVADSIDQLSTDEDANRVYFKDSVYYKENKGA